MDWNYTSTIKNFFLMYCYFLASFAYSYPTPVDFSHKPIRWPITLNNRDVTYKIDSHGLDTTGIYADIIEESAYLWSNVPESILEIVKEDNEAIKEQILVVLEANNSSSAPASGYAEFDETSKDGLPVHCQITIFVSPLYSLYGIAKTILHEMGHCLGLGHSLIPEAIMSYHNEQNSFKLDLDDEVAVSRLYPISGLPQLAPGCGVGDHPISTGRSKLLIILLFFLLPCIPAYLSK
jgi:hypothetical protein